MGTWRGRRVLVTGAGGFIGSHLVERLLLEGAVVSALFRYTSTGSWGTLEPLRATGNISATLGDVRDVSVVRDACRENEVVFHLAALIGIPYSYYAPDSYLRTNVLGTLNVLDACRAIGARVVITSTSEVYGSAQHVPMDETHPLNAQSPYAASKAGADLLAISYHRSFDMPITVLRPFNTYGPRQSERAVIPAIITQLLVGDEVRIGSLVPRRDLTFVSDTVDAFVRAGDSAGAIGLVINAGNGRSVSIGELVEMIAHRMGKTPRVVQEAERMRPEASEVERLEADATLAARTLGWRPSVPLEEGLDRTIEWIASSGRPARVGYAT